MNLVTPEFGLIFWQLITFLVLLWVLSRYAWKPIMTALKDRENSIEDALATAEKAREEMLKLTANNEKLLDDARIERDKILKAAYKVAEDTKNEAKDKAAGEAAKIVEDARRAIETEKLAALAEIKKQIALLSIDIAEKILKKELENPEKQKQLASGLIEDLKLN